ncbi:BREX system ATP-binding domain-containing protein [Deltaproteobacteria bacterium TL4]
MTTATDLEQLKPFQARTIIEALREGSVPTEYVKAFTVGRSNWLKFIEEDLDQYIAEGGSKVRFINGDYGDGKTHFMSIIRHLAMEKDFAVSFVVLTHEVPIHKFEIVYQHLVQQIRGNFEGEGIRPLVNHWADTQKELLTPATTENNFQEKLSALAETLHALPGMNLNFANALRSLLDFRFASPKDGEIAEERAQALETLYQWFEGAKVSKRDLKPFQIFESLNKNNSKLFLRSLVTFLLHLNYKGFVLLMDELETVIAQSTSVRNAAYENVRLLIDNTEHSQNLHIFFSIIPDVLSSEKGFKSYDALWSRVRSIGEGDRLNFRGVLINLHRTPLENSELVELGLSLKKIHELAYRWDAVAIQEKLIEKVCLSQKKMGMLSEVRLFIKLVIRYLDMAEQGEAPDENTDVNAHIIESQKEMEREKMEQLQPKWDS